MIEILLLKPKFEDLQEGDQVVYIPLHVRAQEEVSVLAHPDTQFGFVTSTRLTKIEKNEIVFCRYFYHDKTLRTKANSESTKLEDLWFYRHTSQSKITTILAWIEEQKR
jgi:hypothetical protein